jgi:hypothetical protein
VNFLREPKMFEAVCQEFAQNIVPKKPYIAPIPLAGMQKEI